MGEAKPLELTCEGSLGPVQGVKLFMYLTEYLFGSTKLMIQVRQLIQTSRLYKSDLIHFRNVQCLLYELMN